MVECQRVSIIGLGLIGGSIAAGIRRSGFAGEITGWDGNSVSLDIGHDLGLIDKRADSLEAAVETADLIVLALPVQAIAEAFPLTQENQVVTDVGSVKQSILSAVKDKLGEVPANFVPGHPIAGSERHGVTAANPELFEAHKVLLTPLESTSADAVALVEKMWRSLGAEVISLDPEHHDAVLAQTSHLPHLLAYALVDVLASGDDSLQVFEYAAGGFRDFSRIAASDPVMWRDIFTNNQKAVLDGLDAFQQELAELRTMIESGDGDAMLALFTRAKAARDHFSRLQQARVVVTDDE